MMPISVFRKAEDQAPDKSGVYMALARGYSQKKDLDQAELFLKKAISVSKKGEDLAQSRLALSSLYESTGQRKKAEDEIKIIIGENPDEVDALLIMASFYVRNGRDNEAELNTSAGNRPFPRGDSPSVGLFRATGQEGA